MGRCRVVKPEVVRLPISDGDYIDIKRMLTAGEYQTLIAGVSRPQSMGSAPVMDTSNLGFMRCVAHLLGWSLTGFDDQPLPYSVDMSEDERLSTLRALDADTFMEIVAALDAHEAAQEDAKKKAVGERLSSATSTSPDAATGPTETSSPSTATSST